MSTRHRALLGVLLILCITSLLTLSIRPADDNSTTNWVVSRRNPTPSSSSSSPAKPQDAQEDRLGTGAKGTDPENNSRLDAAILDYSAMTLDSLKLLVRGTILETPEDLLDPTRPIRSKASASTSLLSKRPGQEQEQEQKQGQGTDDEENHDEQIEGRIASGPTTGTKLEVEAEEPSPTKGTLEDVTPSNEIKSDLMPNTEPPSDQSQDHDEQDEQGEHKEQLNSPNEQDEGQISPLSSSEDGLLADFDVNKALSSVDSYMVFVPSGETIEAQFFSLLTSLWIARHSNRTLIIPPPMMSPPSLNHSYPFLDRAKGKKRQSWSTLFDLGAISKAQPIILIDDTRPVLQTPFTAQMSLEEVNPRDNYQPAADSAIKINCHGPPTAGSWKTLDFAGRHFLNQYDFRADFTIHEDAYWDMAPEAIRKHWQALPTHNRGGPQDEDRHRQLICISGAEFIGAENPMMEERIWQDIGLKIPFSSIIRRQARLSVLQVLRAVEKKERKNGYIGIHIDKLPSQETCRRGRGSSIEAAASVDAGTISSQCLWTVDLIAKRIAILQLTEASLRPVIVTTTETDAAVLATIDQQPGWLRIGVEDQGGGLFDGSMEEAGEYGQAAMRTCVLASSAILVGSGASSPAVHAAFRIKNEGRSKQVAPRWELYSHV